MLCLLNDMHQWKTPEVHASLYFCKKWTAKLEVLLFQAYFFNGKKGGGGGGSRKKPKETINKP